MHHICENEPDDVRAMVAPRLYRPRDCRPEIGYALKGVVLAAGPHLLNAVRLSCIMSQIVQYATSRVRGGRCRAFWTPRQAIRGLPEAPLRAE